MWRVCIDTSRCDTGGTCLMVDQRKHNKDCMACLSALGERGHFLYQTVNAMLVFMFTCKLDSSC